MGGISYSSPLGWSMTGDNWQGVHGVGSRSSEFGAGGRVVKVVVETRVVVETSVLETRIRSCQRIQV